MLVGGKISNETVEWISYLTLSRWGTEGFHIIQDKIVAPVVPGIIEQVKSAKKARESIMGNFHESYTSNFDNAGTLELDIFIISIMTLIFIISIYISLKRKTLFHYKISSMKELDNFKFNPQEDILGEGSQGVVYKATDKRLGRKVAIKSLHPHLSNDESIRQRFVEEANLLAQLHHPTIIMLYDYINEDNRFHLIMEYVVGQELNDLIGKVTGPINEIRAIDIFIQILEGIEHIHQKGIIHRDIKPSNIIINSDDNIKLLDFGIAKDSQNDPRLTRVGGNVGGTPMYMSPEHVSSAPIGVKSDIYCLGVTLWQMVTGKYPYQNVPALQIYQKIENEPLPDAREIYPL